MAILFKATKELESQIEHFLDAVSQGGLLFKLAVKDFLAKDVMNFTERMKRLAVLESRADELRRHIENNLYSHTLIPEHRGDVLGLLESTDSVIDTMKETLNQFEVEQPYIPESLHDQFNELTEMSVQSAEHLVKATRAFFKDVSQVADHLHKVHFFEKEADRLGDNLKRGAFALDLDLCMKFHLRYFAKHIEGVSDKAEDVADRLAIYAIKRTI